MKKTRGILIADQPGTGKTLESLAIIAERQLFPALIICPANLRLNWLREVQRWLPDIKAQAVLSGGGCDKTADVLIINYELLLQNLVTLHSIPFQVMVCDEFHYVKSPGSKRSILVRELSQRIAYRIGLTGTPIQNRPIEALNQIDILGRLWCSHDQFREQYCGPTTVWNGYKHVQEYKGSSNELGLHNMMQSFTIRRRKQDVLPDLPEKQFSVIPVEIPNMAEYRKAEADFRQWVAEFGEQSLELEYQDSFDLDSELPFAQMKRLQAEKLRHFSKLRGIIAAGKEQIARDWVANFLESDEKLLVFALHINVQQALVKAFPGCAHVLGADSMQNRMANVDRFQTDPDCRLAVLSMQAAAEGLTLTAASDVYFPELGWAPGHIEQCIDRAHRIGQQADAVNGYFTVAINTVEESVARLLDWKSETISLATDGKLLVDVLISQMLKGY
ncbi:MAG: DEAD/DEAH box helicase [Ignavibacteria bacterium]|nr:DEAD/DEAH box helicase [Ignavibacteria bacterium]